MRLRHPLASGLAAVAVMALVVPDAQACFFFKKRRPACPPPPPVCCPPGPAYHMPAPGVYGAPPPAMYGAPRMYQAPPSAVYPAPRMYQTPPTAPHVVPGPMSPVQPMPAPGTAAAVSAKDNTFDPPTLNVRPGTTVRWTNTGRHPHTVTDRGGMFDSGDIPPGGSYTHTFQTPGTYRYYCTHHKGMEGTIVVGEPGKGPGTGPSPGKGPAY